MNLYELSHAESCSVFLGCLLLLHWQIDPYLLFKFLIILSSLLFIAYFIVQNFVARISLNIIMNMLFLYISTYLVCENLNTKILFLSFTKIQCHVNFGLYGTCILTCLYNHINLSLPSRSKTLQVPIISFYMHLLRYIIPIKYLSFPTYMVYVHFLISEKEVLKRLIKAVTKICHVRM